MTKLDSRTNEEIVRSTVFVSQDTGIHTIQWSCMIFSCFLGEPIEAEDLPLHSFHPKRADPDHPYPEVRLSNKIQHMFLDSLGCCEQEWIEGFENKLCSWNHYPWFQISTLSEASSPAIPSLFCVPRWTLLRPEHRSIHCFTWMHVENKYLCNLQILYIQESRSTSRCTCLSRRKKRWKWTSSMSHFIHLSLLRSCPLLRWILLVSTWFHCLIWMTSDPPKTMM